MGNWFDKTSKFFTIVTGLISIVLTVSAFCLNKENAYKQKMFESLNAEVFLNSKTEKNIKVNFKNGQSRDIKLPIPVEKTLSGFPAREFVFMPEGNNVICTSEDEKNLSQINNKKIEKANYKNEITNDLTFSPIISQAGKENIEWSYFYFIVEGLNGRTQSFVIIYQFKNQKLDKYEVYSKQKLFTLMPNNKFNHSLIDLIRKNIIKVQNYMDDNKL